MSNRTYRLGAAAISLLSFSTLLHGDDGLQLRFVPDPLPAEESAVAPDKASVDEAVSEDVRLTPAAQEILETYRTEAQRIRRKTDDEIQQRRNRLIERLQELQDQYTRAAKLDEAVAIRDRIRRLKVAHFKAIPNPGSLVAYGTKPGRTFYFDVVGSRNGTVWGTEQYTLDSSLAAAAVHAGLLKSGQRGILKVTITEPPDQFTGSARNGVNSQNYATYPASYTIERPLPSDVPPDEHSPSGPTDPADATPPARRGILLDVF